MSFISAAMVDNRAVRYPDVSLIKGRPFIDEFGRETLAPTGAYTLYTAANNGGGTAAISNARSLLLTTSAGGAGEDVDVRTSGLAFGRGGGANRSYIEPINKFTYDVLFSVTATDAEGFIGVINTLGQLSGLPTTTRHIGLYYDLSAGANFMLTSANGSAQVTTDTTQAVDTSVYRLHIEWDGDNSGSVSLYSSTNNFTTLIKTQAVTALATTIERFEMHFFVQTEAAAAKLMEIDEWSVTPS